MEKFMFDRLMGAATRRGVTKIVGVYRPTPKNAIVADLYEKLGFRRLASTATEVPYELVIVPGTPLAANHISDITPREAIA
jgi:predicted enzyme involved in methoxymalonyl-ACP biosynthesis